LAQSPIAQVAIAALDAIREIGLDAAGLVPLLTDLITKVGGEVQIAACRTLHMLQPQHRTILPIYLSGLMSLDEVNNCGVGKNCPPGDQT
jgi:hypothetical protein